MLASYRVHEMRVSRKLTPGLSVLRTKVFRSLIACKTFYRQTCAKTSPILLFGHAALPPRIPKQFLRACVGWQSRLDQKPARASVARFFLRSRDPVERLARDAVLSEKEAQLGRVFLHVAQGVQLELEKAHRLPPLPGESHLALRLLI